MILYDETKNNSKANSNANSNTNKMMTGQLFDKDEYDKFKTLQFVGLLLKNNDNKYVLRLVKK